MNILYSDAGKSLRLLGESDQYFIVLNQLPFNEVVGSYPEGAVYFVDKKDVLVTRIDTSFHALPHTLTLVPTGEAARPLVQLSSGGELITLRPERPPVYRRLRS